MKNAQRIGIGVFLICLLVVAGGYWHVKKTASSKTANSTAAHPAQDHLTEDQPGAVAPDETVPAKVELSPSQVEALSCYERGLTLYYDHKIAEALVLFNQALDLDPQCYQAINGKGASYAFQGRYSEGIELIEKAIQMKPDFVYARFNLGLAYELAGRWDESIKAYHEALKIDDEDVWSYYGIASIYGRQGNVNKVIEYLKPAIALESEVKAVAREEKDFDPVKHDLRFIELITK
ncbi:Tetratricopeptide TPR_1 repeat-containing protein [Syntrophobotulus glycolicus DSM 8271]|uniref:Tetratricopeptide TPR_1 repeat-containing protein n=1 Tax=Syntrophobotulus glycolicus (strain DSM 8271 / FlGlyR) TaxID=645991 RepID=F0SYX9_SYNGF|nr:tetratricopeptide repeat protein [Syntrophobotulus glycolicus]ADY56016.1 Tetratricopeptide TPR_1 repeat-containing protein [Syntrophobotulus glycolicus DSM 8271]